MALCECGLPWAISNIRISCVQVVCAIALSPCQASLPDAREKFRGRFQIFSPAVMPCAKMVSTAKPRPTASFLDTNEPHWRTPMTIAGESRAEIGECGVVKHGRRILIKAQFATGLGVEQRGLGRATAFAVGFPFGFKFGLEQFLELLHVAAFRPHRFHLEKT